MRISDWSSDVCSSDLIHHKRWGRDQAVDYIVSTIGFPRPRTVREIDRYCVSPGQATSYKVGHTQWMNVRGKAKAALGDRFDIRQYHQILLKGAMPLTVLEREVDDWVKTRSEEHTSELQSLMRISY